MKIIIDSRETKPLEFVSEHAIETVVECLPTGDYMVEFNDGYRPPYVFERKSLGDLFGSFCTKRQANEKKKVLKAHELGWKYCLIIEKDYTTVKRGYEHSSNPGIKMIKTLWTLSDKYDFELVYCSSKHEMAMIVLDKFIWIGGHYMKNKEKVSSP